MRARVSANIRRTGVVVALAAASAVASVWRPAPDAPRAQSTVVNLVPAIFTAPWAAGPPVSTGCKGSPVGNFGTTSKAGVLAIAMNSLTLVDYGANGVAGGGDDTEVPILTSAKELNFATNAGVNVGDFVSSVSIAAGTYEAIKGVMDNHFRILCAVTCSGQTYVTKGGATNTAPDGIGGVASESTLDISGGQGPQSFNLSMNPPMEVTNGANVQKNLGFSATGACELWDVSSLLGHGAGTDYKILPVTQSANVQ